MSYTKTVYTSLLGPCHARFVCGAFAFHAQFLTSAIAAIYWGKKPLKKLLQCSLCVLLCSLCMWVLVYCQ